SVEPTEFTRAEEPFATTVLRRARTTEQMVERQFVPLLKQLLEALERPEEAGWNEARIIWELNRYFMRLDHRATFRAEATWRVFRDTIREQESGPDGLDVRLDDLIRSLRWMYSFLLPITCPVPRTDVSHATLAGFAGLAGVIAKLEYGTPFMVTDHGIYLRERYIAMSNAADETYFCKRFLLRLVHLVSRVCYVTADQISPVCDHNQRWELRMGATPDKIQTIYNGIDTTLFKPPPPEKDAERDRPTVVTAARVFPLKDIETLIRACDVTRRRVPDVHFVVFGNNTVDKPYTDRCMALIDELGVGGNFTFAGYHSNPAELYHEGDVFALSSISEGFPFSVIEAMACERPVVATDVGGVKEALVGGIGIVVPPRGYEPLGDGLADLLLDDDRRRELGRLSRERAVDEFGVERMLDAHREAYERFAGMELFPALTFVEDLAAAVEKDLGAVLAESADVTRQLEDATHDAEGDEPPETSPPLDFDPTYMSDLLSPLPTRSWHLDVSDEAASVSETEAGSPSKNEAVELAEPMGSDPADAELVGSGNAARVEESAWVARSQETSPSTESADFWSWLAQEREERTSKSTVQAVATGSRHTSARANETDERGGEDEASQTMSPRHPVGDWLEPVSWEARRRCA
ncbi:MAG: GT4 family glycosyltransferase PelF, partial [Bacteroidota bacterium]